MSESELPQEQPEKIYILQGLDEAVTTAKHRDHILEIIALQTTYKYGELKDFYDHYKSYDLLLAAINYCSVNGFANLRVPPIIDVVKCPNCQTSVGVSRNVGYVQNEKEPT